MRFTIGQRLVLVLGLAAGSLFLAGQLLAQTSDSQTSCTSQGYKWCTSQYGGGWCTNSTTGTCPANTESECSAQNGKWCKNSDGATGWCSSDPNYKCTAYTASDCTAQGGEWCTSSGGGSGWCNSTPGSCPINDQATCESKGRSWCTPQSGGYSWCTYSSTEKCPAYTEADCKAQSRTWCVSPGTASTSGWCTDSCPYSSTADQKTQCTTANGKWCLNSDGASGYCSYGSSACPAYNATDCSAQGGEWCSYSSGSGGWCNSVPNSCPVYDKTTCESKGRKWCTSSYGGSGWCTTSSTETCPSGSTTPTTPTTPTPDYSSWPNTQADCEAYSGLWCKSTGSYYSTYTGSCMMANNTCPTTPKSGYMTCWDNTEVPNTSSCPSSSTNEADCTKTSGRYWCKSNYTSSYGGSTSSGWCQGNPCSLMPPAGQMTCPDGKTFASNMSGCPKKTSTTPTPTPTPVPPSTPPPTSVKFTWPNSQSDCELYSGNWCKSEGYYDTKVGGWCNMATQKCPIASKPGYMTCWDNTQVRTDSFCPVTPINATDCKRLGYNWCTSAAGTGSTATSGWCSANACGAISPAGQMTCPDGTTFSATLEGCPKKETIPPEPVYVICPDGSRAVVGTCSNQYTCADGSKVKSSDQCPKPMDEVSTCLSKGGVWCKDPSGIKSGYCAAQTTECKFIYPPPTPKPPEEPGEQVSAREVKQDQRNMLRELRDMERTFKPLKLETLLASIVTIREKVNKLDVTTRGTYEEQRQAIYNEMEVLRLEVEKQNLLRELKDMERVFKSLKDETMLAKIAAVRDEVNKMTVATGGGNYKEDRQLIYDDMEDLREAMRDAQEEGRVNEPERDKKFQEQALRDMKKSVKMFERFLSSFDSKVKKVEKQGIAVDPSMKDLVVKAKDLVARAKEAKTYDEAREIMDQMPELGEDLNEVLSRLEQLARLPEALKVINRRTVEVDRAIKTTAATVKRLKIDAADEIQKMQTLLTEAKEATTKLKAGSVEDADTFFDYIQENIMEKLDEALTKSQMIQTVANVKKYINKVAADLKRFERRIVQLEKKNEDVSEARALLDEAKTHLEALRATAAKKLSVEVADEIIEHLGSLFSLDDQLEEVLKLTAPDELERRLRRLFEGAPKEQLKSFEVGVMEKTIVKAYQTANFFRLTPARSMAIVAE